MNRQELARLFGVHRETVTRYVSEGLPVLGGGGRGQEAQYDAVVCLEWQRQRRAPGTTEQERTRYFKASADKIEQEVRRRGGDTIDAGTVEMQWATIGAVIRERFLSVPVLLLQRGLIHPDGEEASIEIVDEILTDLAKLGADATEPA